MQRRTPNRCMQISLCGELNLSHPLQYTFREGLTSCQRSKGKQHNKYLVSSIAYQRYCRAINTHQCQEMQSYKWHACLWHSPVIWSVNRFNNSTHIIGWFVSIIILCWVVVAIRYRTPLRKSLKFESKSR